MQARRVLPLSETGPELPLVDVVVGVVAGGRVTVVAGTVDVVVVQVDPKLQPKEKKCVGLEINLGPTYSLDIRIHKYCTVACFIKIL